MDTAHLELARANRKVSDTKDPGKQQLYMEDQRRCQDTYDKLKAELDASFTFVLQEAKAHSPSGEVHPLGLLYRELSAFKQSQKSFYAACHGVASTFADDSNVDVHNIWTDFQDRRLAAIEASVASVSARAQSGRDLMRQGLSGTESPSYRDSSNSPSQRFNTGRGAPPPPPPPPASLNTKTTLYDYVAQSDDELSFRTGDTITIIDQSDPNWWTGRDVYGNTGLVPSNYF